MTPAARRYAHAHAHAYRMQLDLDHKTPGRQTLARHQACAAPAGVRDKEPCRQPGFAYRGQPGQADLDCPAPAALTWVNLAGTQGGTDLAYSLPDDYPPSFPDSGRVTPSGRCLTSS